MSDQRVIKSKTGEPAAQGVAQLLVSGSAPPGCVLPPLKKTPGVALRIFGR